MRFHPDSKSGLNKTLYLCFLEQHPARNVSYVVKLSDLLLSDDDDSVLQLNKVGYKAADGHLAASVGCGVFGSQILFAAGITLTGKTSTPSKPTPKNSLDLRLISLRWMLSCSMAVVGGKLVALSYRQTTGSSFEVFDPDIQAWNVLPFWRHFSNSRLGYVIIGTKMFMSYGMSPVYCFDIAHEARNWRRVDSMCSAFDFHNEALVLDIPGHPTKKLMFACNQGPDFKLGVYIMFLDEGQETMIKIGRGWLPALPPELCRSLLHSPYRRSEMLPCCAAVGLSGNGRASMRGWESFEFQVDFDKINKDIANCLTLEFKPTREFEFYTSPGTFPDPHPVGCFIL